jgi:hypothetical protein
MSLAEIVIRHILWGHPGMVHITPDGKKLYTLDQSNTLQMMETDQGSFHNLTEDDINDLVKDFLIPA